MKNKSMKSVKIIKQVIFKQYNIKKFDIKLLI